MNKRKRQTCKSKSANADSKTWSTVENLSEAQLLLYKDVSKINELDKNGMTPLHQVLVNNKNYNVKEILKFLLEKGGTVKEGIDIIMLFNEHCHDFSVIEILLKRYPNYDVNTRDRKGRTLLMNHCKNIDDLNKLLNLGADPTLHCNEGNTALVYCEYYAHESMKKLLDLGVNPMQYSDDDSCCDASSPITNALLNIASSCHRENEIQFPPRFEVVKSILSSPQVKNNVNTEKVKNMYLDLIFDDIMFDIEMYMKLCHNSKDIFSCIFQNNNQIITTVFHHKIPKIGNISFSEAQFEMFGHGIVKLINLGPDNGFSGYFEYLDELVKAMLETYPVLNPNPDIQNGKCISPLAVLLLAILFDNENYEEEECIEEEEESNDDDDENHDDDDGHNDVDDYYNDDDFDWRDIYNEKDFTYHKEERFILFKEMLSKGTNINSVVLNISKHKSRYDLNKLKRELEIPDALLVAFLLKRKRYVEELLPHWWGPPVVLLLFCQTQNFGEIEFWLPLLMKHGGISPCVSVFEVLKNHMRPFEEKLDMYLSDYFGHGLNKNMALAWQKLKEQLYSPSLQNMSMYAVRRVFYKQATYPDNSLPKLLEEQVPPLLRPIVLRHSDPQ